MAVGEAKLNDFLGQFVTDLGATAVACEDRFTLNAEQALALSDPAGPLYVPGAFVPALAALKAEPRVSQAFRTGARLAGYDYHARSVEQASKAAADAGLGGRVRFAAIAADGFPGTTYGLITTFDCLHDMSHPVAAARHIREALADDGTWLLVEPAAADDLAGDLSPVGRIYYAFLTLLCVPSTMAQEPAVVLGSRAGEARAREIVTEAGFTRFRHAVQTPFSLVFEVRP